MVTCCIIDNICLLREVCSRAILLALAGEIRYSFVQSSIPIYNGMI